MTGFSPFEKLLAAQIPIPTAPITRKTGKNFFPGVPQPGDDGEDEGELEEEELRFTGGLAGAGGDTATVASVLCVCGLGGAVGAWVGLELPAAELCNTCNTCAALW